MKRYLIAVLLFGLAGCAHMDKAVLTEVKTADGKAVLIPNPVIVGTTSVVGPALGPYGVAGSAVIVSGLSLYAALRNRKSENELEK